VSWTAPSIPKQSLPRILPSRGKQLPRDFTNQDEQRALQAEAEEGEQEPSPCHAALGASAQLTASHKQAFL